MKKFITYLLLLILSVNSILFAKQSKNNWKKEPGLYAVFQTSMGKIVCKLFENKTPVTVNNFVNLAQGKQEWMDPKTRKKVKKRYYDGLIFHRVIPKFMIQGGCPLGTGYGGPGYRFNDEIHADLKFDKPGRLAMANSGPNTNGSQFFITEVPTNFLNGGYTIFGQTVEGLDLVPKIANVKRGARDKPLTPVVIKKVSIIRIGGSKMKKSSKKVIFIVPPKDFRDEEYFEPKTVLEKAGIKIITASQVIGEIKGYTKTAKSDILLKDIKVEEYDAVAYIGGKGSKVYWNDELAQNIAKQTLEKKKVLAAICSAPVTLANAGILNGKTATSFSGDKDRMVAKGVKYSEKNVEIDGNIITANGPAAATAFGKAILKAVTSNQ